MSHQSERSATSFIWLRVGLLVAGIVAGLWLSFIPAPSLYRVRARSSADLRRMQTETTAPTTQTSAIRLTMIPGDEAGQELAKQISETSAGKSKVLLPNLDTGLGENDYYFSSDQSALKKLAGSGKQESEPTYMQVTPAGRLEYLEVTYLPRGVGLRHAPTGLAYPLRQYAVWCFVAGIAGFVLLPHRYYRWRSLRAAEFTVAIVLAGGLISVWLLGSDVPRPLEKRTEVSPDAVAEQERIVKELPTLKQQMNDLLADIAKTPVAQQKPKLEAYKALKDRYTHLSEAFTNADAGSTDSPTTKTAK